MMNFGGFGWIALAIHLVITLAVIAGLVLLIVWAVRRVNGTPTPPGPTNQPAQSAREILKIRYARGEVNREEYEKILADLDH